MRIEEVLSPDGLLRLRVVHDDDGDVTVGLCLDWHTHGSIIASANGLPVDAALAAWRDDPFAGRLWIALILLDGVLVDAVVVAAPYDDAALEPGEQLRFRRWATDLPQTREAVLSLAAPLR